MVAGPDIPAYNLKVVVRETGLKPDTIRAWERRYGLPAPDRTEGGHRLYSQHDIDTLKWLVARQQEGLSISRAVDLWHALRSEGQSPLAVMPIQPPVGRKPAGLYGSGPVIDDLRRAWIEACLAFDEQRAETAITEALSRFTVEAVCSEILQEGLAEIGEMWYSGGLSVQQEHFASALAIRRIESFVSAAPAPTRPGRIIVGCPAEENHTFGPLLITLMLKRQGWDVIYLGANVPTLRLAETIQATRPRLVILSAQQVYTAAMLLEAARVILRQGVMLGYGGHVFTRIPELAGRIPGIFLGADLQRVPEVVEQIMLSPLRHQAAPVASEAHMDALRSFRENHPYIEAAIWQAPGMQGMDTGHLEMANESLSRNIVAGLILGDLDVLSADMDWISGLLVNYNVPVEALRQYLVAYAGAARTHLGEHATMIVDWLEEFSQKVV